MQALKTKEVTKSSENGGRWSGTSRKSVNGQQWLISTTERERGIISCVAYEDLSGFKYAYFPAFAYRETSYQLFSQKMENSKESVAAVHKLGLCAFDVLDDIQKRPKLYVIEPGQVLTGYYPQHPDGATYIVIETSGNFVTCINLEHYTYLHKESYTIKDIKDLSEMGTYYTPGKFISSSELNEIVNRAQSLISAK